MLSLTKIFGMRHNKGGKFTEIVNLETGSESQKLSESAAPELDDFKKWNSTLPSLQEA
ncbi:hypothetical protein [Mesorhizobium sp.]|uniref:hypothetical protein n=1 Tax=Mesorhizobium sp. TaxID=1871066 RepID=UPI0025CDBD8F|nr:hypothetical protein [Mesorhizobium sp.]